MSELTVYVPKARLCADRDDAAAQARRKRIAEMLRDGQPVSINSDGVVHANGQAASASSRMSGAGHVVQGDVELVVPTGKLALI